VIFEKTVIYLTNIDKKWEASHFDKASSFYWVADQSYCVSNSPVAKFAPEQVTPSAAQNYSIRLFVRPFHFTQTRMSASAATVSEMIIHPHGCFVDCIF
jgi:hypothetical protein